MIKLNIKKIITRLLLIFLLFSCSPAEKEAPRISTRDFFRNPEQTSFKLSPNGEYISFLKPYQNRMNLFVMRMGEKDTIQLTSFEDRGIEMHFWVSDSNVVFAKDKDGDENYKLFSVNYDATGLTQLTPDGNYSALVIDPLIDVDDRIIIRTNERDSRVYDVYRVDINNGYRKMIAKNPGNISSWLTDHKGKLRAAVTTDGVNTGILYRDTEEEDFRIVKVTDFKEMLYPVAFTFDNKFLYAISNVNRDRSALVKYDPIENKEIEEIFEHYEVDLEYAYLSRKKQKITAVTYQDYKREYEFLDDEWYEIYKKIKTIVPDREIWFAGMNRNEDKFLIRTYNDRSIGEYYYYDHYSDELTKLADISPWLNENDLAHMKPVSYKSRDGLTIHGYLTLPLYKTPKNLPAIIFPHGGPWTRDKWGFDNVVQFFANRGYAVLQMNYRGSTGYGKEFMLAGYKELGNKIQDDITDGVDWLIRQEIAHPQKISVFGISFGGYCALQGLVKTPELYCCGISNGGLNNILYFIESMPSEWEPYREMLYEMFGNPLTERQELIEISPYFNLEKIKSPVFIAQGKNDKLIDVPSTEIMIRKMKKLGIEVEYMLKENEGHLFKNEENIIEFYEHVEKFLNKHITRRGR
ncbi:MAG: S9 family peptidase [Melioribacteraceae bacterium]|nr:S9 family peptidase [Melioribacteraceae bacterium]